LSPLGTFGLSGHFWALWELLNTFGPCGHPGQFRALSGTLGSLGTFGHSWRHGHFWALWVLWALWAVMECPKVSRVQSNLMILWGSWMLYTRKLEVAHKEVGGCHESWMNEKVMCGHTAEVMWLGRTKVGVELLWQLKRLQNLLRHVVMVKEFTFCSDMLGTQTLFLAMPLSYHLLFIRKFNDWHLQ